MAPSHDEALLLSRGPSSSPLSSVPESHASSFSSAKLPPLDETTSTPAAPKGKTMPSRAKKKTAAKRTPAKSKWNAENILTDPKSPLATAELRSIISNPMAWEVLDEDERAEIVALLPDEEHILKLENGQACFNLNTLLNDDSFRRDCAAYTRNIADGKHDPEWLASAWSAYERRKMGDFDEFLIDEFEENWDVELPERFKPHRKSASEAVPAPATLGSAPSAESTDGTKEEDCDNKNDDGAYTKVDQASKTEDTTHAEVDEPSSNGGKVRNGSAKGGEAVDELQAVEKLQEPYEMPPVKRQKKVSAKGAESEDELA